MLYMFNLYFIFSIKCIIVYTLIYNTTKGEQSLQSIETWYTHCWMDRSWIQWYHWYFSILPKWCHWGTCFTTHYIWFLILHFIYFHHVLILHFIHFSELSKHVKCVRWRSIIAIDTPTYWRYLEKVCLLGPSLLFSVSYFFHSFSYAKKTHGHKNFIKYKIRLDCIILKYIYYYRTLHAFFFYFNTLHILIWQTFDLEITRRRILQNNIGIVC